jgi:flagella basal body P-ring formation protein FlgA
MGLIALAVLAAAGAARGQDAADETVQGDLAQAQTSTLIEPLPAPEKFVPRDMSELSRVAADMRSFSRGTIVLRSDATVSDDVIRVKNVCRWTQADAPLFQSVAELAITHLTTGQMYATVSLDDVRQTLGGAGMNLALISFGGTTSCAINRSTADADEAASMTQWIDSHQPIPAAAVQTPVAAEAVAPASQSPAVTTADGSKGIRSLRSILAADLCGRLQIDPENLELSFNSSDEKVLKLVEPYFQFEVTPVHAQTLGSVAWDVVVVSNGHRQKTTINATASQWQLEAVMLNPVAYQQIIRDQDVQEKRVLTQYITTPPPLVKARAVGQQAARELKPGTMLTSEMVDPVLLVRPGQLVTVTIIRGTIRVTAVAKAMEGGSFGQTIRARNDIDPSRIFEVMMTGPQEGTVTGGLEENESSPMAAAAN